MRQVKVCPGATRTFQILCVSVALLLACIPTFSQGNSARIVGVITDQTGGSVAGATVTVLDVQRGTTRTLTADESGSYNAPNLIPGEYKVRAEFKGFKIIERQNIVLEVGQEVRVDLSLQPGEQTQTITVTEQIPLVETTNASLGGTLQNEVINDLPLNGRNFQNLLSLRPGVTKYPGGAGWTSSTNGVRPHDQMFLVDGVNSNDPWMAQSMMNATGAAGDAGTILPIDAIQEFKTEVNPRAEYGWKPGAVINIGLKSGANTIHGTAFAFGRAGGWDARNFFNKAPQPTPPVEVEQFGGSIGGPIKKDKLFYFANFEAQRYSLGNPAVHVVPVTSGASASNSNTGLLGACNAVLDAHIANATSAGVTALSAQLAGISFNPAVADSCAAASNYPGLFPASGTGTVSSAGTVLTTNKIFSGIGKVDYHINGNHTVAASYFISPGDGTFSDSPSTQIAQPWLTVQHFQSQVAAVGWTWTPTSSLVNDMHVGYSHFYQTFFSVDAAQNPANYNFNGNTYHLYTGQTIPTNFGFPGVTFTGYSFVWGLGWPKIVGPDAVLSIADHVSILHGNHSFKFGGEILRNQSKNDVTANLKGPLRFPSLQNYFAGLPDQAAFTAGDLNRDMSSSNFAVFVQDDWRIKPRLTLNLGVRYELDGVLKDAKDQLGNFDPIRGFVQVGSGITTPYNGDHNNFAPRLGLAWDVRGNGKTVVRAGAGLIYEQGSFDEFNAVGNLIGLRTVPTGVPLVTTTGGVTTVTNAGGNIAVGPLTFTGASLGPSSLTGTVATGSVAYNWANNSPTTTLYTNTAACGDGNANSLIPGTIIVARPCSVMGVDRNLRIPYVTNWTLDIQRALTNNLSLDVAYVGNHGTKLLGLTDLNQAPVGAGYTATCLTTGVGCSVNNAAITAARPFATKFPYVSFVEWLSNLDNSNYNGLQVTLTQRESHGLSFVAGYTYSHSLDQCPDNWRCLVPLESANLHALYGNSGFDVRHRFTYSVTYAIPGMKSPGQILQGWSINSILTLMGRFPWDVTDTSTDFAGNGEIQTTQTIGDHWDFFGNPSDFNTTKSLLTTPNAKNAATGGIGLPFFAGTSNATCLAKATGIGPAAVTALNSKGCYAMGNSVLIPPAFGTIGTLGRNVLRGPGFTNVDLSVSKTTKIKERLSAQFRAEAFNIFNHPNIGNPNGGPGGGGNSFTNPSGANFGSRNSTPDIINSNPVLGAGGARAIQLGLKLIF